MSDIKIPTVGRMVHYFPNESDQHTMANGAKCLPATVVQSWGNTTINVAVTCMNPDAPVVLRYSVMHKSSVPKKEGSEELVNIRYWDWPEIK